MYMDNEGVEYRLMEEIIRRGMTVSTAESCTGGMVASRLINYPGASEAFVNGFVTYTNESKHRLLGVRGDTLDKYGAVSPQTAEEMCIGAAKAGGTNIGISTTGIAGPSGGSPEKPVGLVYVGLYINGSVRVKKLNNKGSRQEIREQTTQSVLNMLFDELKNTEDKNGKEK